MKSYAEYDWPMKDPNKKPFAHQRETVEFLLSNKRAYNLSDIGTGKTLSALWAADVLMRFGKIKKVLIIAPLSTLQVVWGYEIFTNMPHRYYYIAHGNRKERLDAITSEVDFVIINHDGVTICQDELIQARFDLIIIDELTAFKNASTDRSKAMRRVAIKCPAVWGMTGLLTPNSPTEAYGQAKVINPYNPYLPMYFSQFRDMVVTQLTQGIFIPTIHADEVVHAVVQPAIRFTRDECLDLPPVLHQYLDLEMTAAQQKLYDQMRRELYAEYENGSITAVNAGVKLNKLLQISAGAVVDDDGAVCFCDAMDKIEMILQTFEELGRTKLIVVASYRAVVERVCRILQDKGIDCEYIHGGVSMRIRSEIIDSFQHRSLPILVVQPDAMAHGITLTASNTIVWQSMIASGETYTQMNGRITRAGQTKKQFVKHLVCSSAERRIVKILDGKTNLSQAVMKLFANREL